LTVTDDWPEDVPVTEAEIAVFEEWVHCPQSNLLKYRSIQSAACGAVKWLELASD
jgi:hypothetical protein